MSLFCLFECWILLFRTYSSSHIAQITDFLEFLHEYCKEKSETCTKFLNNFVVNKNIKIGFWPAAPVNNRHKIHCHREFTCKRDITFADPRCKMGCSLGYKYFSWKFLLQIFFILHQLHFHAKKKSSLLPLKKIIYFSPPDLVYGKLPIICYFLLVLRNYCTSANNFYVSS